MCRNGTRSLLHSPNVNYSDSYTLGFIGPNDWGRTLGEASKKIAESMVGEIVLPSGMRVNRKMRVVTKSEPAWSVTFPSGVIHCRERECRFASRFGRSLTDATDALGMKTSAGRWNRELNLRTCSIVRFRSPVMNMETALSEPN